MCYTLEIGCAVTLRLFPDKEHKTAQDVPNLIERIFH